MRTIKQTVEIDFNAITIQEAVILVPLMDRLIDSINYYKAEDNYDNNRQFKKSPSRKVHRDLSLEEIESVYKVLSSLGFCGSGKIDLLPDGYPLEDRK